MPRGWTNTTRGKALQRRARVATYLQKLKKRDYTYVLAAVGFAKIGRTRDLDNRIAALQTGCPGPIEVLACVSHRLVPEKPAHEQWAHLHSHLEWFRLTPELAAWAEEIQARNDALVARCEAAIEGHTPRLRDLAHKEYALANPRTLAWLYREPVHA